MLTRQQTSTKKFYIVPRNEGDEIKELRVSTLPYYVARDGPISTIKVNGKPIEDMVFTSIEAAYAAIEQAAPWLVA